MLHSGYLIGSYAQERNTPSSDLDLVYIFRDDIQPAQVKLFNYELYQQASKFSVYLEPYFDHLSVFKHDRQFYQSDFIIHLSLSDHGKCLFGESIIPDLRMPGLQDVTKFRIWLSLVLLNALNGSPETRIQMLTSILATLLGSMDEVPQDHRRSKLKLLDKLPEIWPEAVRFLEERNVKKILRFLFSIINTKIHHLNTNIPWYFRKSHYEFEQFGVDYHFLFTAQEKISWKRLHPNSYFELHKPYERILKWLELQEGNF